MISNNHIFESKKRKVLQALFSMLPEAQSPPPEPEMWPKTRQLADLCSEDIYTTRLLLLSLEREGKILCSHRSIRNSLRWYPVSHNPDE